MTKIAKNNSNCLSEQPFFKVAVKKTKPLKTTKDGKAILVSRRDKRLYDWAKNG